MRKLLFAFLILLFNSATGFGQKVYELDEVKQIPYIDESNMEIIANAMWASYKEVIKNPEGFSTLRSAEEVVNGFYDYYSDGVLKKVNPVRGKQYSVLNKADLEKNNRLRFNLSFDESGKILIPEKLYIISYRNEEVSENSERKIYMRGLVSFEFPVSDSIKSKLITVRLQRLAKADKNSLTRELLPVRILLPFDLEKQEGTTGYKNANEVYYGEVMKKNSILTLRYPSNHFEYEDSTIVNMLKEQTNIMTYKKGLFSFEIRTKYSGVNIDINIFKDTFIASGEKQRKYFGEGKAYIQNFKEEEKTK
jgi:hypothetical protein